MKIYGEQDENKTRKEVYFVFGSLELLHGRQIYRIGINLQII